MNDLTGLKISNKRFESRVIVVTGAAQGIGRATVLRCAAEGANIVAVDRDASLLETTGREAADLGVQCEMVVGNISDVSTIETMIDLAVNKFGRLDGLVNNAATAGKVQAFSAAGKDEFDQLVAINVFPVWRAMQLAQMPMQKFGRGSIVNIASMAALRASRGVALYGMTKGAVVNLTMNAALDYARDGIRVNAVCPGPIGTSMLGQIERAIDKNDKEAARKKIASTIPLRRCGTVWDIANAVTFLLSDESDFMTGVLLPVDGGISIKQ